MSFWSEFVDEFARQRRDSAAAIALLKQSLENDRNLTLSDSELRLETDDGAVAVFQVAVVDYIPADEEDASSHG
ncbi:hypothetical protein MOQ72_37320 [Saccharopolyspora sp. K220]|uniref:hypothetical protein n=1 Tax=Saccharopolyspora soli TaxID=2926618 RepID=UPI001F5A7916|nr:hypothetical protein [Saccharopolyspora soli]MCI2423094.1 hypothetical protein [Saccharopolyspora soli]